MCSVKVDLSNLSLIFSVFKPFERFWICRFFRSGFNMQVFQIWKTSGTTYLLVVWKSSGLLGSLLTKSPGLPVKSSGLPVKSSGHPVKSSGLPVKSSGSRMNFLKVF